MKSFKVGISLLLGILSGCSMDDSTISLKEKPTYELESQDSKSVLNQVEDFVGYELSDSSGSKPNESAESRETPGVTARRTVKVAQIYDGDTIRYYDPAIGKEVTARLIGINAPEYSDKEKQILGKEATLFLTKLIQGQEIQIEGDPNADVTDRYGRYLIHAFIGGKSIQQILLMEGLVRVAYLYGEYRYTDGYIEAERIAKEADLNIWSIPGYVDSKNGFNMDVVTGKLENINKEVKENAESITNTLTRKALEKAEEWKETLLIN